MKISSDKIKINYKSGKPRLLLEISKEQLKEIKKLVGTKDKETEFTLKKV